MREERLAELKTLLSELQSQWTALGGPIDAADTARYGSISEDLVTEDRILAFKAAITEASAERQRRLADAKDLERDIRDLRMLLCVDRGCLEVEAVQRACPHLAALAHSEPRCVAAERATRAESELARRYAAADLLGVAGAATGVL